MNDNYDDIKHLTRPKYDDLPEMSVSDRAAQFSPFAALTGFYDMIDEKTGSAFDLSGSPEKNSWDHTAHCYMK